jgi:NitT/TauT family transport system substrate-binding protein
MADERDTTCSLSRRTFLQGVAGLGVTAATAALLPSCGSDSDQRVQPPAAVEGPPETTTIRLPKGAISSFLPWAVASEFMKEEGFTDVQYVSPSRPEAVFAEFAAGQFDLMLVPAPMAALRIDAGDPIVILGGVNAGLFQILGSAAITSMGDFRGRTLATSGPGAPDDVFLAVTLANVGIDVRTDVTVVTRPHNEAIQALIVGEADGMTSYPPFANEVKAKGIGHVVLDANTDRPWSQYLFSMAAVHRDFFTKHPVATKRALRALFKAADVVAKVPARAARAMVDLGFMGEQLYEATVAGAEGIRHDVWRSHEPADTLRFYALRMGEADLIESTPDQILDRGADFRFLQELRRELKEA